MLASFRKLLSKLLINAGILMCVVLLLVSVFLFVEGSYLPALIVFLVSVLGGATSSLVPDASNRRKTGKVRRERAHPKSAFTFPSPGPKHPPGTDGPGLGGCSSTPHDFGRRAV
jgi:hypothetical protein